MKSILRFSTLILATLILAINQQDCSIISNANSIIKDNNDAIVLTQVLSLIIEEQCLPDFKYLYNNNPYNDSIIFLFNDRLLVSNVKRISKNLPIKYIHHDSICSIVKKHTKPFSYGSNFDSIIFPNVILIDEMCINDSTATLSISNTCVNPYYIPIMMHFDSSGNKVKITESFINKNAKCVIGHSCGGFASFKMKKKDNKWIIIEYHCRSGMN